MPAEPRDCIRWSLFTTFHPDFDNDLDRIGRGMEAAAFRSTGERLRL